MNKLRIASLTYAQLRADRAKVEYEIDSVAKYLKTVKRRKVTFKDFTLFIDDSSRTTLPRQAVVDRLGVDWVKAHERTTRFKVIRVVGNKK
jgi:hypothetical protein